MPGREPSGLSVGRAMTIAMSAWGGMLVLLLFGLGIAVSMTWPTMDEMTGTGIDGWFISAMVVVAILPSVAAFLHRYLFHHNLNERGVVTPRGYLLASFTLWGSILIAGAWSVVTALIASNFVPHGIPIFISMFLLLGTWPNGKAMVKPRSRESDDDTEILHIPPEDE